MTGVPLSGRRLRGVLLASAGCLLLAGCGSAVPVMVTRAGATAPADTSTTTTPTLPPPIWDPVGSPFVSASSRTWQTGAAQMPDGAASMSGMTIRQFVHCSVGGDSVAITFSNVLGAEPLVITAAHVAVRDTKAAIVAGSDTVLTFGGAASVTVAPGSVAVSDAVAMTVKAFGDVAVTTFFGSTPTVMTGNPYPVSTSYTASGDATGRVDLGTGSPLVASYFLTAADVSSSSEDRRAVVVGFGDSGVEGNGSTVDGNHRWLDVLGQRLAASVYGARGMANAGIAGNRLLHGNEEPAIFYGDSGLSRFGRDALAVPGVETILVSMGLNDIGATENGAAPQTEKVTADDLIAGYKTLIAAAHAQHVRILGATLTPAAGFYGFTAADEATRQAVNTWMRSGASGYDGVMDFDAVVRDPAQAAQLAAKYDSGDGIHPNDAGYAAMAGAIDLSTL